MSLQLGVRAFLVHAHETAVAGHVCSQNGGEPSLQAFATQSTPPDRGQFTPRVAVAKGTDGFDATARQYRRGGPPPRPISGICGVPLSVCPRIAPFRFVTFGRYEGVVSTGRRNTLS